MSFILDALKKSESERQQQSSAEFAGIPTGNDQSAMPRWIWIVALLLLINLAVLIGIVLRPDTAPAIMPEPIPTGATEPKAEIVRQRTFEEQVAIARENPPPDQQPLAVNANPVASAVVRPDLISQDPSSIPSADLYPTIYEVRANGVIDIPDLHLDIHVYGPQPAERFVFINMSKLRENDRLREGPSVTEITPDGVVLSFQGHTFLLPRD